LRQEAVAARFGRLFDFVWRELFVERLTCPVFGVVLRLTHAEVIPGLAAVLRWVAARGADGAVAEGCVTVGAAAVKMPRSFPSGSVFSKRIA
jgi:hypothetical protein